MMKIDSKHTDYLEFVRNEIDTLSYFYNQPSIQSNIPELYLMANKIYHSYFRASDDDLNSKGFKFDCRTELSIQGQKKLILIEGFVLPGFADLSYQVAICHHEGAVDKNTAELIPEDNRMIRKFHFDYASDGGGQTPKKPIYHLQHGGSANLGMKNNGINAGPHKWIEVPRFHSIPFNLALMMDLIFSEFPSVETISARDNDEWRALVKKNEDFILKPYFENIVSFLGSDRHSASNLLRDFYYGA